MHLFYKEQADLKQAFTNGNHQLSLPSEEAAHLRVMRLKAGDEVMLTDGLGNLSIADINEITNKICLLTIKGVKTFERPSHRIHLAVAPTKNIARFEWFLEKATEIGIDEITPVYCEYSERGHLRVDRLNKVIISAMKQSLKAFLPKLNEPVEFKKFITNGGTVNNAFIAWLDKQGEQKHLKAACKINAPTTILIGPEGDYSPAEIALAKNHGFVPVSLGPSRLRTETAALVACLIVNILNDADTASYPMSID